MQLLKELSQKWWYRFLKVIFVSGVILLATNAVIDTLDNYYPETERVVDREGTTITCENGNEKRYSLADIDRFGDIQLSSLDFNTYRNSDGKVVDDFPLEAAEKLCDLEGVHDSTLVPVECNDNLLPGASCITEDDVVPEPEYTLNKSYTNVQEGSISNFFLVLIGRLLVVILIEEIIRRAFYYTYFGKFIPEGSWLANKFSK